MKTPKLNIMKTLKKLAVLICTLFFATNITSAQSIDPDRSGSHSIGNYELIPNSKKGIQSITYEITPTVIDNIKLNNFKLTMQIFSPKIKFDGVQRLVDVDKTGNVKYPVFYYVHGGGWNPSSDPKLINTPPPATLPGHADILSEKLGIIYVGLSYSCIGNPALSEDDPSTAKAGDPKATFGQAIEELKFQIKYFEEVLGKQLFEDAADFTRIGFGGGSAGSALSSRLSQYYEKALVYVGNEGMYDLEASFDKSEQTKNIDNSNFPKNYNNGKGSDYEDYGINTKILREEYSAMHNLNNVAPATLLFHGQNDYQCDTKQSIYFGDAIRKKNRVSDPSEKAYCKVVLYDDINHSCIAKSYPQVFRASVYEVAQHFIKWFEITPDESIEKIDLAVKENLKKGKGIEKNRTRFIEILRDGPFEVTSGKKTKRIIFNQSSINDDTGTAIEEILDENNLVLSSIKYDYKISRREEKLLGCGFIVNGRPPVYSNSSEGIVKKKKVAYLALFLEGEKKVSRTFFARKNKTIFEYVGLPNNDKNNITIVTNKATDYKRSEGYTVATASTLPRMASKSGKKLNTSTNASNDLFTVNKPGLYPNPTEGTLFITNVGDDSRYSIYNVSGQLIVNNVKMNEGSIEVGSLEAGLYIMQLESGAFLKFVKE